MWCCSWLYMACKQFPTNENHGALLTSAYIHPQYDFGQRSCSLTVRGMYDVDNEKGIEYTYYRPNFLQYGNVQWHDLL